MAALPARDAGPVRYPAGPPPPARPRARGRIEGVDVARALAMAGMVVVHFVFGGQEDGTFLGDLAQGFSGRAMPLFVLLGGLGVTLMTARSATPDRALLIRAAMLLVLGLILNEVIDRIAIILQFYGFLFVAAVGLRRLPSPVLLGLAPVIVAVGAFTYQTVGVPPAFTNYDELFTSPAGIESLLFDGYYPFFPVGAFFVFGMWLGRLDLRSDRVAGILASVGVAVGIGVVVVADGAARVFELTRDFGGRAADRQFHLSRLLDVAGHSAMPAWVLSAIGSSVAVLGISLLVARRWPTPVKPFVALGALALTFYVFQAVMTLIVADPSETTVAQEWWTTLEIYFGFMVFAVIWRQIFRSGPLEWVLRLGSGGKRLAPVEPGQ